MTRRDWLLLCALSVPWGCSFYFFKVLGAELPPVTVALGRVSIAAAALCLALGVAGQGVWQVRTHWRGLLALGLLNNAVPFTLFAYGETLVTSGTAAIFNAMAPILTVLVLRVTDGAKLGWRRVAGVLAGFAGVAVLAGPGAGGTLAGQAACFLAALSYGLGAPVMGRLRGLPPMLVANGQLVASTVLLLPVCIAADRPWLLPMPSQAAWLALLGLALFSTALAYALYFTLVRSAGPANAMLVTYLLPVTALLLGWAALDEAITPRAVLGMIVILAGLALLDGRWLSRLRQPGLKPNVQPGLNASVQPGPASIEAPRSK